MTIGWEYDEALLLVEDDPVTHSRVPDDRRIRGLAQVSIAFAVLLAVGEAVRNWGDWQWWPFWLIDYIAAGLLFVGGRWALKTVPARRLSPLVGALGFCASLGYMSFFGHLSDLDRGIGTNGPISHIALTAIIGVLFALAVGSFLWLLTIAIRVERG